MGKRLKDILSNQYIRRSIMLLLIGYQLLRMVVFINQYGGLEHDSGWFLGLARTLAETGRYATMVSTIADPTPGGHENIYGQYNIQDEAGRVYFFTESGVYAAGILPNALIIRLFGAGFWQYRAGPLLFCFFSLGLASYLLHRFGGLLPVAIMHLFFFFYPRLLIFLGYEAMGEIFSLAYILLAFVLFIKATDTATRRRVWFLGCGLAAGLAIATKPIALLSLGGLGLAWLVSYLQKRNSLPEGLLIAIGGAVPLLAWELIQLVSLTMLFDFAAYQNHLLQRVDFFMNEGGSGLGEQGSGGPAFFWHKLSMVREISGMGWPGMLLILLAGGPYLIWREWQAQARRNILILLWGGWLAHSAWFVLLSKNGWMRHDWYALMLAVFLLSLLTAWSWQRIGWPLRWRQATPAVILTGLLAVGFAGQREAASPFISEQLVERWYQDYLAADHTRIPWSLVPRRAQQEAVAFINELPAESRFFYPEGHKSAEMAVLTGRILYPIQRRYQIPPAANDIVLIGPSLISPWRKPTEARISPADRAAFIREVMQQVKRECPQIMFQNEYYILCALD